MKRLLFALLFLLPTGVHAQSTFATVVATCGTPPGTYAAGERRPILMDTNGNLCSGSTSAGGIGQVQVLDENEDLVEWGGFSGTYPGLPAVSWSYAAANLGIVNTTTAVTVKTAAGASLRNCISTFQVSSEALGAATEVGWRDGAAGTVMWRSKIGTAGWINGREIEFNIPLCGTANTLLEFVTLTASVTGAVYVNAQGLVLP